MKVYVFLLLSAMGSLEARRLGEPDCEAGCDLKKRKVCGTDGVTYYNECLAICQVSTNHLSFSKH